MGVSNKINAMLNLTGKRKSDLMELLGMSSRQSLSNKFSNERWSANDLIDIAEVCGCKVAFILPDGTQLVLDKKNAPDA